MEAPPPCLPKFISSTWVPHPTDIWPNLFFVTIPWLIRGGRRESNRRRPVSGQSRKHVCVQRWEGDVGCQHVWNQEGMHSIYLPKNDHLNDTHGVFLNHPPMVALQRLLLGFSQYITILNFGDDSGPVCSNQNLVLVSWCSKRQSFTSTQIQGDPQQ